MARWGITPFPRNWVEVIERVYCRDSYGQAARELGLQDGVDDRTLVKLFDGVVFNPDDPLSYLDSLTIHREICIAEIAIDEPVLKQTSRPLKTAA
jgi:nitrate/nitrite transport system ATP-binding protein